MAAPKSLLIKLKIPTRVQPDVKPAPNSIGIYSNKMHFLKRHLLDELRTKVFALDFMQPVDSEALQVPTYYMIIQRPMDLGTISMRLQNLYYHSVDELIDDFRLVISNCYTFNRPDDLVYRNGQKLERFFLRVLKNMPAGPEVDNSSASTFSEEPAVRPILDKSATILERRCREQMRRIQSSGELTDTDAREFSKELLGSMAKKLSQHQFKTLHEFHSHLDATLLQSRNQAKRIFQAVYQEPLDSVKHQMQSKELSQLFYELQKNDPYYQIDDSDRPALWEDALAELLDVSVERLARRVDECRLDYGILAEVPPKRCRYSRGETLTGYDRYMGRGSGRRSYHQEGFFSEAERQAIQQQFMMLPPRTKMEIVYMIAQTEDISTESCDLQWYDVQNFRVETLHRMKRAMHPYTKLNLRNMKPSEKEDLQRSLETRLQNINQALSGNRRKYSSRGRMRLLGPPTKRGRYSSGSSTNSYFQKGRPGSTGSNAPGGSSGNSITTTTSSSSSSSSDSSDSSDSSSTSSTSSSSSSSSSSDSSSDSSDDSDSDSI